MCKIGDFATEAKHGSSKNPAVSLELHYRKWLELGMVLSLALALITLYSFPQNLTQPRKIEEIDMEIEVEEVPPTEQLKRPPPPPRPAVAIPPASEDLPLEKTLDVTEMNFE